MGNNNSLLTVAIAEDQQFIRDATIYALEKNGPFQVTVVASNGLELIQKLILNPVDIVLLDINMPIMNGDEVMEYLKKTEKKSKIILYSLYDSPDIIEKFLKKGAHGYITKDTDLELMIKKILEIHQGN